MKYIFFLHNQNETSVCVMMISLVLVSLGRRGLQEYLRAGAGPTLETEASSFRKESPSPEARGDQLTDVHQGPPFGRRVSFQIAVMHTPSTLPKTIPRVRQSRPPGHFHHSSEDSEA